jgi:hypothetical protein
MLQLLETFLAKFGAYCYKRGVRRALALHLRGEVRRDGLNLSEATTHLEIEWHAREIHPWDRGLLSPSQSAKAFVEQALADTEAAIYRLFSALCQVDTITLRVRELESERLIISGTVLRPETLALDQELSIGMRLRYLGARTIQQVRCSKISRRIVVQHPRNLAAERWPCVLSTRSRQQCAVMRARRTRLP